MPVYVLPDETVSVMMVPSRHWPKEFVERDWPKLTVSKWILGALKGLMSWKALIFISLIGAARLVWEMAR